MNFFDNLDQYNIAYEKIVSDTSMLSATRLLAARLQNNPYLTVKDFIEGLSNEELFGLLEIADQLARDYQECVHGKDLVLISEMLVRAEGLISSTDHDVAKQTNALCSFLACEGLARRGLVKIYRERMSFGEDMADKVIVEKLSNVNYDDFEEE